MTADPCAHDVRWVARRGGDDPRCIRCNLEAVQVVIEQADIIATLRARAEEAERERDAIAEESVRHAIAESQRVYLNPSADLLARYDRLREAARGVVEGMKCWACGHDVHEPDICKAASPSLHICIHGQPMKGMSVNWWDSYSKLAEEATQKPAGEGEPSEGGR